MLGLNSWLYAILGVLVVGALVAAYKIGRTHEANAQAVELLKATARAEKAEKELRDKTREIELDDHIKQTALDQRLVVQLSQPRPIRLCEPAGADQSSASRAADSSDAAGDRGHVLSPGPDIAPALLVYARDCERIRQKLTTLQNWAAAIK
jgi:hypothetical protein